MTNTTTTPGTSGRLAGAGRYVLATRPLGRWRTVDLLAAALLGVAFGVVYWAFGLVYSGPAAALEAIYPPAQGLVFGPWLLAGVVGGLVIRRPGAALFAEMTAASVSALIGTKWGATTLVAGFLQGIGAELGFALFRYAAFGLLAAIVAGALSTPFETIYEWYMYWTDWDLVQKLVYGVCFAISGAVLAGGLGFALTRALASAGALNAFPPGQEARDRLPG
ncbi:MAG TPA: ECF transporter S component [Dermatophilaceae bacterium]|nr:ECF transporter S component [Dermatophilaceae bacterium]